MAEMESHLRAATAEFIGTLLFTFLSCGSVTAAGMLSKTLTNAGHVAVSMGHGISLFVVVAAITGVSGGHINPAVTFAFIVAGKQNLVRAALYGLAQFAGAVAGAGLLKACTPDTYQGNLGSHTISHLVDPAQGLLLEAILTFVLVFVIFGTAVDRRGPAAIAPIAIGFAVLVDHLVGVPYTGTSLNPARSFGPAVISGTWKAHWIYWAGPFIGATMAAAVWRFILFDAVLPVSIPTPYKDGADHQDP